MSHRTYGATIDCKGCRYWSEMLARTEGGPVMAYCLAPKAKPNTWKSGTFTCAEWASGFDGAIDEPGSDPDRYTQEDAA